MRSATDLAQSKGGPRRSRPSVSRSIFAQLAALGHLGAIVSVITKELRDRQYYRAKFGRFRALEQVGLAVADLAPTIPAPRKPSETAAFSGIAESDNQHYRSLKAYPEAYPGLEAPADAVMMMVPVAEPAAALTMAA
jgi:hypothetical protein